MSWHDMTTTHFAKIMTRPHHLPSFVMNCTKLVQLHACTGLQWWMLLQAQGFATCAVAVELRRLALAVAFMTRFTPQVCRIARLRHVCLDLQKFLAKTDAARHWPDCLSLPTCWTGSSVVVG